MKLSTATTKIARQMIYIWRSCRSRKQITSPRPGEPGTQGTAPGRTSGAAGDWRLSVETRRGRRQTGSAPRDTGARSSPRRVQRGERASRRRLFTLAPPGGRRAAGHSCASILGPSGRQSNGREETRPTEEQRLVSRQVGHREVRAPVEQGARRSGGERWVISGGAAEEKTPKHPPVPAPIRPPVQSTLKAGCPSLRVTANVSHEPCILILVPTSTTLQKFECEHRQSTMIPQK